MTVSRSSRLATTVILAVAALAFSAQASLAQSAVEQILGRAGAAQPGGVIKFSFPRTDLTVIADSVTLKPAFALGGWVAFKKMDRRTSMVMGDLVLTEDEVAPVMRVLQEGGVEQTAVHNHLLNESPRIIYVHISARGEETKIATTLRNALATTKTPLMQSPPVASAGIPGAQALDTAGIARALGYPGKLNGVVYQVSIARPEEISDDREDVPPSMGVSIAINFQPIGDGRAAITGDFVLRAGEVNPVIRALQSHGIRVTALHSHMINENPRLLFMHFWGKDDAVALAKGLRAGLDQMSLKATISGN
jgi:hypothetical protein